MENCNLCRYYSELEWCSNPKGVCDFELVHKKDYKDRLLSEYDVIRFVMGHMRKDGILEDDIFTILKEINTAFDKEKVIEELTAGKFITIGGNTVGESVNIRIDRAVEIVEKGGIE